MSADGLKAAAAEAALALVEDGMTVGLGTGSTAEHFVKGVGRLVAAGLKVRCIGTSTRTEDLARSLDIPLTDFSQVHRLNLIVDGADEIDPHLNLIKGGGGAHLREKIVAAASDALVIIADESKRVDHLGAFPLPVEIVQFAEEATRAHIAAALADAGCAGAAITKRVGTGGSPFVTDCGNVILDCACGALSDPGKLAHALDGVPGVVEHGLFIQMASAALVAGPDGVRTFERETD